MTFESHTQVRDHPVDDGRTGQAYPDSIQAAFVSDCSAMLLVGIASMLQNALLFAALPYATHVSGSTGTAAAAYLYANAIGGILDPIGASAAPCIAGCVVPCNGNTFALSETGEPRCSHTRNRRT